MFGAVVSRVGAGVSSLTVARPVQLRIIEPALSHGQYLGTFECVVKLEQCPDWWLTNSDVKSDLQ